MSKRKRSNSCKNKTSNSNDKNININQLVEYESEFNQDAHNQVIQNAISLNPLSDVCQNRKYMQGYDRNFSNVIDPALDTTDQAESGRCWIFAVLNVARFEMITKYELEDDFEFSQSYLSFWDKIEKCNHFLNEIIANRKRKNYLDDFYIKMLLASPVNDGGNWSICKNLIKKYGLVPKSVFDESYNSSITNDVNFYVEGLLRKFAHQIDKITDDDECYRMKNDKMSIIYDTLSKLFGSPKLPDNPFLWSYCVDEEKDLLAKIKKQKKFKLQDKYENLQLKKSIKTTPLEYYHNRVPFNCDNFIQLTNDPRNPYYKCYGCEKTNSVSGGDELLYINLPIELLIEYTKNSILDNYPVVVMCDVEKHLNINDGLLDTKCFDHKSVFKETFEDMTKSDKIRYRQSAATHAMTFTGVDINDNGDIIKWKVDNSWGEPADNFIMTNDWFKEYVFEVIVNKKYIDKKINDVYNVESKTPILLPFDDPMVS